MTAEAGPPDGGDDPLGRPGRKLGPIAAGVGAAHRDWLEPVRDQYFASGLTVGELARKAGWSKSKVSELLRGVGLYPSWELTYGVLHVLGMPAWPMRRLWSVAALEAHKKPEWVNGCVKRVVLSAGPGLPPVDHRAFAENHHGAYASYAKVFLGPTDAARTVDEVFDILWLRWQEVLRSANVEKFAWQVLRRRVMARASRIDGRPRLETAAFDTIALQQAPFDGQFAQIEESLALFRAIGRLPDFQLDVIVLRYLRGLDDNRVADVLGAPQALIRSAERHAKRSLTASFDPGENHS
ncbi:RNA polymerase subunit sigma [Streptomyces luteireticuli]|uniref:RNA polymerase subunit sigma n=1 Tax=Streptomyces luteireticuli TaxID=173858 RepID=UPI0035577F3E